MVDFEEPLHGTPEQNDNDLVTGLFFTEEELKVKLNVNGREAIDFTLFVYCTTIYFCRNMLNNFVCLGVCQLAAEAIYNC